MVYLIVFYFKNEKIQNIDTKNRILYSFGRDWFVAAFCRPAKCMANGENETNYNRWFFFCRSSKADLRHLCPIDKKKKKIK